MNSVGSNRQRLKYQMLTIHQVGNILGLKKIEFEVGNNQNLKSQELCECEKFNLNNNCTDHV